MCSDDGSQQFCRQSIKHRHHRESAGDSLLSFERNRVLSTVADSRRRAICPHLDNGRSSRLLASESTQYVKHIYECSSTSGRRNTPYFRSFVNEPCKSLMRVCPQPLQSAFCDPFHRQTEDAQRARGIPRHSGKFDAAISFEIHRRAQRGVPQADRHTGMSWRLSLAHRAPSHIGIMDSP